MDVSQSGLCSGYQSSISMWLTGGQFPEDKHSVPEASMSLKDDEDGIDTEKKKKHPQTHTSLSLSSAGGHRGSPDSSSSLGWDL